PERPEVRMACNAAMNSWINHSMLAPSYRLALKDQRMQLTLLDHGVDFDRVAAQPLRALQTSHFRLRSGGPSSLALRALPPLGEVAKEDLGMRLFPQLTLHLLVTQIAEQPVADTPVGDRSQLLLHRSEHLARRRFPGQLQQHWRDVGEPADR